MACLTMSKLLLITLIIYAAAVSPTSSTSADIIRRRRALDIDGWAINSHVRNLQHRRHNNERFSTLDDKTLSRLRAGGGGLSKTLFNREQAEVSSSSSNRTKQISKTLLIMAISTTILAYLRSNDNLSRIKSLLSTFFNKERFRSSIISTLNNISSKGNAGLLLYTVGFIFYETCGLPTSVVETCAGMAFGFRNGLLCSFVGKTLGSILAFTLGRTLLSTYVDDKLKENESFALIERGVAKSPVQSALIVRYSPFPQLIKNFGLSVTHPVSYPIFILAIVIHGFPFSLLWASLGYDSSLRLRASDAGEVMVANKVLNGLLVFVTFFGFVVSPIVTGWWLNDLRKEKEG